MTEAEKRLPPKREIVIIIAVLALLGLLAAAVGFSGGKAETARVLVDGQTVKLLSLSADCEYLYTGSEGAENLIVVKNGGVSVVSANCRDGLCVNQGAKSRAGQSIVCLPHKLIVQLEGDSSEVDAYAK
ncbi:MAG: NusG domain II-containing protein [Eubacteriales bacterium]|nr:NusG domain II-containing protein [Eubacteriales bacterium]